MYRRQIHPGFKLKVQNRGISAVADLKLCSQLKFAFPSMSLSQFNTASMVTQTQMQRLRLNVFPASTFALLLLVGHG